VYRTNPLEEVLCQLKFPPILRIESELPTAFQDEISAEYPGFQEGPTSPQMNLPPALANIFVGQLMGPGSREFHFISPDTMWKVVLNREFIALSTSRYKRWEEFTARLEKAFSVLKSQYKFPIFFTRIGLRYKNLIRRSAFGGQKEPWSKLLSPHILGELSDPNVAPNGTLAARQIVILLDDRGGQVRLNHGLVVPVQGGEICYSIDIDLFTEIKTEVENGLDILKGFNRQAGRLFRWCITEYLHNALKPGDAV